MPRGDSQTNIYNNPAMKLGNYDQRTQDLLQHPWLAALNDFSGAGDISPTAIDYASGGISLQDALKAAKGNNGALNQIFTGPISGTKAATDQVMSNPLMSGYFGKGGIQDQRQAEEQNLASRGYSLQPEDYEAYGQASDNIARMFGTQENSLAQALASHGFGAGPSGAAAVSFSGLMGNKAEQLAQSQRQIANDRMKMNAERLNAVRGAVDSANKMSQSAVSDQYGRNLQGAEAYRNNLKDAFTVGEAVNSGNKANFEQEQATRGPGIGDVLGGAATIGLGAATGGLGSAIGGGLGKKILGGIGGTGTKDFVGPPTANGRY